MKHMCASAECCNAVAKGSQTSSRSSKTTQQQICFTHALFGSLLLSAVCLFLSSVPAAACAASAALVSGAVPLPHYSVARGKASPSVAVPISNCVLFRCHFSCRACWESALTHAAASASFASLLELTHTGRAEHPKKVQHCGEES